MHWFPRGPREREQRNGSVEVLGYWEQVAPGTATESFVLISVVLTAKCKEEKENPPILMGSSTIQWITLLRYCYIAMSPLSTRGLLSRLENGSRCLAPGTELEDTSL